MPFRERLLRLYPFTWAGNLVLAAAIYLLASAWNSGNIYAISLSLLAFASLFLLSFLSRIQAFRFSSLVVIWDGNRPVYARISNQYQTFFAGDKSPMYFFRFHIRLDGRLIAGRDASFRLRAEAAASAGNAIRMPLNIPVCGSLRVESQLVLRDVFGFTRAYVGEPEARTLTVRPPLFPGSVPNRLLSAVSEESKRRRMQSEEEKFYMREYMPGDKLKDINWKASIRVDEMITRIAPASNELSYQLDIDFRHFKESPQDGPVSIMHLNYIKSWMLSFMRAIKTEHPAFRFTIRTGLGAVKVESEQELEAFAVRLSELPYMSAGAAVQGGPPSRAGQRFVFSTEYDARLSAHLRSHAEVGFTVFRTMNSRMGKRKFPFLNAPSLDLMPGMWLFRKDPVMPDRNARNFAGEVVDERLRIKLL